MKFVSLAFSNKSTHGKSVLIFCASNRLRHAKTFELSQTFRKYLFSTVLL